MINKKVYITLFICSILIGIAVTFHIYVHLGFIVFLGLTSFLLLLIIGSNIFTKKQTGKTP